MSEQKIVSGKKIGIGLLVSGLLLIHLLISYTSSKKNSAVADEPFHLSRGVALVFFRDFSFAVSHPPLINFLNALPLLSLSDLHLPERSLVFASRRMDPSDRRNAFAHLLLQELNPDSKKLINRARITTIFLSGILGLFIFIWGKQIFGIKGALLALFLYCFDPNILAHSHLATNDLGALLFILLSVYFYLKLLRSPKSSNFVLAGIFLGLAQLAKFTAILLYPLYVILCLINWYLEQRRGLNFFKFKLKAPELYLNFWSLGVIFFISWLIIWAGYGFQGNLKWNFLYLVNSPICQLDQATAWFKCKLVNLLGIIPLPPRTFFYGLSRTLLLTEQHENVLYFLGKNSQSGWWYYYPVLFLIKTPLSLLIFLSLALISWKKIPEPKLFPKIFLVLTPMWFFVCFVLFNRKEIGLRHILVIYPFIFLLIAGFVPVYFNSFRKKIFLTALLGFLAVSSITSWPDYLTYFNEAVGRKAGGLKISVLGEDWGQSLIRLAEFQKRENFYPLFYQPYVIINPASYGLKSQELNCEPAQVGYYALHLTQLVRPIKSENLTRCVELLKSKEPLYKIDGTIWVWKL